MHGRNKAMPLRKTNSSAALIGGMLGEASWLLSHAQALGDYGREEEAAAELARAAVCEEQVACLLEAAGEELEAAVHRVSAASCLERIGQAARAVTLLRAALSSSVHDAYRARIEKLLARCLVKARKELRRVCTNGSRKRSRAVR
jgi:hypothetical protein